MNSFCLLPIQIIQKMLRAQGLSPETSVIGVGTPPPSPLVPMSNVGGQKCTYVQMKGGPLPNGICHKGSHQTITHCLLSAKPAGRDSHS